MAIEHWLCLALTAGIGPILGRRIIAAAGSAQAACCASVALLAQVQGIGSEKAPRLHGALAKAKELAQRELQRCATCGYGLICPEDEAYPPMLQLIDDPPLVLYMRGQLEPRDLNALAIVGSRRCSFYGREQSQRFAALLAGSGFTIVSGGARGVDSAAHQGALSHPLGRTIAVLGCGVDQVYPPENGPLFDQIAGRGVVLSEFPLGTAPTPDNFPRRNRIVSGLSRGVLVVEADERSGALITARLACEDHNRPVFAVPGRVDNSQSQGPHLLIRQGAVLTRSVADIYEELGPLPAPIADAAARQGVNDALPLENAALFAAAPALKPAATGPLDGVQAAILTALGDDAAGADELIARSGLPAQQVMSALTMLGVHGRVRRTEQGAYRKVAHA